MFTYSTPFELYLVSIYHEAGRRGCLGNARELSRFGRPGLGRSKRYRKQLAKILKRQLLFLE
jgi:hypothetical protein